jgi:hypothetical protein
VSYTVLYCSRKLALIFCLVITVEGFEYCIGGVRTIVPPRQQYSKKQKRASKQSKLPFAPLGAGGGGMVKNMLVFCLFPSRYAYR